MLRFAYLTQDLLLPPIPVPCMHGMFVCVYIYMNECIYKSINVCVIIYVCMNRVTKKTLKFNDSKFSLTRAGWQGYKDESEASEIA